MTARSDSDSMVSKTPRSFLHMQNISIYAKILQHMNNVLRRVRIVKKQSLKARDTIPLKYWWWVNLSPDRYFDILQLYTVNPATPWGKSTQVRIPGPQAGAQNQWTVPGDFVKKFSCTKIVLVNKLLWWNKYKICNPFNSFGEEIL